MVKKPSETNNYKKKKKGALGDLKVALLKVQIKLNDWEIHCRNFYRLQSESATMESSRDTQETLQTTEGRKISEK